MNISNMTDYKNELLNSSFDLFQRASSFTLTASDVAQYGAPDRWWLYRTGSTASTFSGQTGDNALTALRIQRTAGNAQTTTTHCGQTLETVQTRKLAGKRVTFSFTAKAGANFSSPGSSILVYVATGTGTDQGSTGAVQGTWTGWSGSLNAGFTITTTATRYTYTFTLPSSAREMAVFFAWDSSGTAGANDWLQVENVMLHEGAIAQPYKPMFDNLEAELAACQRYYEVIGQGAAGAAETAANLWLSGFFKVTKRIAPALARNGTANIVVRHQSTDFTNSSPGFTAPSSTIHGWWVLTTGWAGLTSGAVATDRGTSAWYTANAEL